VNLFKSLSEVGVPEAEIPQLAAQAMVLPDYKGNPRVANENEMIEFVRHCYREEWKITKMKEYNF
jgi:alcohol dehydrogenase class IV